MSQDIAYKTKQRAPLAKINGLQKDIDADYAPGEGDAGLADSGGAYDNHAKASDIRGTITGSAAKEEVKKKFVLESHMRAMERASTELNAAFSFREAGEFTIEALSRGLAAKGHNILEKTIKPSSVEANYGKDNAASIMDAAREMGLAGVVGKWEGGKITGVYVHDWSSGMDRTFDLDLEQPATLESFKKAVEAGAITPYTGDYDMHDIIFLSGSSRPVGVASEADSEREKGVKNRINELVAQDDERRPLEREPLNVVRHGPQVSFATHMMVHEYEDVKKNKGFLTAVAEPGPFPVAFVNKSEWTIVKTKEQLFHYYRNLGTAIPPYWKGYGEKELIAGERKGYSTTAKLAYWFGE
ncbi:hypothetical protein [Pseudoxanthomonas sp. UTMC 1351]|uniref:hypothetical protein n=1 Tax=Pseudoxanthomonas sp. UTMC 1351 TaxID=2695853 RepID=UPI0034CF02ED